MILYSTVMYRIMSKRSLYNLHDIVQYCYVQNNVVKGACTIHDIVQYCYVQNNVVKGACRIYMILYSTVIYRRK